MKVKEDLCFLFKHAQRLGRVETAVHVCVFVCVCVYGGGGYLDLSSRGDFIQLKGIQATLDKMFKVGPHNSGFCCVCF